MSKTVKPRFRNDLRRCYWSGRLLGRISQRLDCAGGSLNKRDFNSAEHHIYQAKLELKDAGWVIGKTTARRLSKLLDDPYLALQNAQQAIREGRQGLVSRGRLRTAEEALRRTMARAMRKCE